MWNVKCGMMSQSDNVELGMGNVECEMWNVECRVASLRLYNWQRGKFILFEYIKW